MADKKESTPELVREYVIPLRREFQKTANYRRTGRAVKEIKKFIARHMKVPEHDTAKVKLDQWLNQEVWFRGKSKPPARIKVKATKVDGIVRVELAELPAFVAFEKAKRERRHKPADKPAETPKEEKSEEKTAEQKEDEKEKEKSVADVRAMESKQDAKFQKSAGSQTKAPSYHRMALKK